MEMLLTGDMIDAARAAEIGLINKAVPLEQLDDEVARLAASIVAKVVRDRLMVAAAAEYPGWGFERHKGYGTASHMAALARLGPSPLHRRSFAPVARVIAGARG